MSTPFIGEIRMFAGNFAPRGWALCNGQLLAISGNDALFSLLGTFYGGDGRVTFGLPDLRGRVPVHQGTGPGLTPRAIGRRGGVEAVTVSTSSLPRHDHGAPYGSGADATSADPAGNVPARGDVPLYAPAGGATISVGSTDSAGGSQPHTNLQPYACVNFIIALFGTYPSRT